MAETKIGEQASVTKATLDPIIKSYNGISKGEEDGEEGSRRKEEFFNFPFLLSRSIEVTS